MDGRESREGHFGKGFMDVEIIDDNDDYCRNFEILDERQKTV